MYKEQAEQLLRDVFFQDWMNQSDWEKFLGELEFTTEVSIDSLSKDIEIGVKNGYSVESQIELVKGILKAFNQR
jgi:3-hydroxyisobutyrate dehydrogenase-like beta-hydroxyacid dehydrogenase